MKVKRGDHYEVEKVGNTEGPNRTNTSADHMKKWMTSWSFPRSEKVGMAESVGFEQKHSGIDWTIQDDESINLGNEMNEKRTSE